MNRKENYTIGNLQVETALVGDLSATSPVVLPSFAVADLPDAGDYTNGVVVCSDGAAGSPCLAVSDGTNWKQVAIGANVSAV